ncbi:response regulator [Hydrogenophaga laconesensis]|uniref:CheY-like chemotaxis protein n=1 Tax=Hydrogenophaga laconesensis TaxID=1805971 RepID=A0ABU1V545_9BURK|nr:response regulator [Hydrogenophaga laconesensis]MDR7092565.1 CheY-like chemotaxis protein [Hydrogenophaga laconesensis]
MRILYVEDNPELREIVSMLLEGDGRTVTACATAEDALAHDAQEPFDLVMSDAGLPGISGTELARTLLAANPRRWIVLCSGYELGRYPLDWGPHVRTLLKPFEPEDLERLLDSIDTEMRASGGSARPTGP